MITDRAVIYPINGRDEALVFTTAALMAVQKKFGGITELAEAMNGPAINEWDDPETVAKKRSDQVKAQSDALEIGWWLMATLANQGRMLVDRNSELLTVDDIMLYTYPSEAQDMMQACMDAIAKGQGTYHKQEETPIDPILEEVEKNGEGAGN